MPKKVRKAHTHNVHLICSCQFQLICVNGKTSRHFSTVFFSLIEIILLMLEQGLLHPVHYTASMMSGSFFIPLCECDLMCMYGGFFWYIFLFFFVFFFHYRHIFTSHFRLWLCQNRQKELILNLNLNWMESHLFHLFEINMISFVCSFVNGNNVFLNKIK